MITINKYNKLLVGVFIAGSMYSYSQTPNPPHTPAVGTNKSVTQEAKTQPLELPALIIEGKEQLNVQAGMKQFPSRTLSLTKSEIDSINPVQKLQALLLPPKSMPTELLNKTYKKGYLQADLGNYTTANILAGYETSGREYTFFGKAFLNYTDGHLKNADYKSGGADLSLFYIAPKKYWIFGGSKTIGNIAFDKHSYKMYGMDSVADRDASTLNLSVSSEGEYNKFDFSTGAGYKIFQLDHNSQEGFDNAFTGFLKLKTNIDYMEFQANTNVQLDAISGNSTNLFNAGAGVKFLSEAMTFDLNGAFQSVGSTDNIQRANIMLDAGFDYRISNNFTFRSKLTTGFDNQQFEAMWHVNKYMTNSPIIDFSYDKAFTAYMQYHPDELIMASFGMKISATERQKFFQIDSTGVYDLLYADANGFELFAKGAVQLTDKDKLYAELNFNNHTFVDNSSNKVPFIPSLSADIAFDRNWTEEFGTKIVVNYIGARYADIDNKKELDAYINLKLGLDYKLNKDFKIYGIIDNLLNSNIYIWDKYKEREIYIAAGILWQF